MIKDIDCFTRAAVYSDEIIMFILAGSMWLECSITPRILLSDIILISVANTAVNRGRIAQHDDEREAVVEPRKPRPDIDMRQ